MRTDKNSVFDEYGCGGVSDMVKAVRPEDVFDARQFDDLRTPATSSTSFRSANNTWIVSTSYSNTRMARCTVCSTNVGNLRRSQHYTSTSNNASHSSSCRPPHQTITFSSQTKSSRTAPTIYRTYGNGRSVRRGSTSISTTPTG